MYSTAYPPPALQTLAAHISPTPTISTQKIFLCRCINFCVFVAQCMFLITNFAANNLKRNYARLD